MFNLLSKKRFGPFFLTMGLGAFNDNLFKSALAILIAYNFQKSEADILIQLSAGLFILPFFILSGISGQICDKFEKTKLMQLIKTIEIIVMCVAVFGFYINSINVLLFTIFLMGAQSTLFGPVKYSTLPIHLKTDQELISGNSLTSLGTFLFILIGTILGGLMMSSNTLRSVGYVPISIAILLTSILGRLSSQFIPLTDSQNLDLKIKINPILSTWNSIKLSATNRNVFHSIHGISWFWFFGFFFLASLPSFTRDILKGDETVATLFLTLISFGMGIGSIVAKTIFKDQVKLGAVPLAAICLGLFGYLFSSIPKVETINPSILFGISDLLSTSALYLPGLSLLGVGIFGGMFIVPLYTQLQISALDEMRSRLIASNNIINSMYMVGAAVFSILLLKIGLEIHQIFKIVSLSAIFYGIFFIFKYPRDFYLAFFKVLMRLLYKIEYTYEEKLPKKGPIILVSNHISFIDPLLITSGTNRPPIFIMDQYYFDIKPLQWFFTSAKAIPIVPAKISKTGLDKALSQVDKELDKKELVCLFPEGFITKDGEMQSFKTGVKTIADKHPEALIIPMALSGMWGSWFSRHKGGKAMRGLPKRRNLRTKIQINFGRPVSNDSNLLKNLENEVLKLRTEK